MSFARPCAAAALAAALLSAAAAQPPAATETRPTPLLVALLPYVSDETFAAELTLSPEQVKKLTDYRQKVWDEAYTTAPAEYTKAAGERNAATAAAFKTVLTPAQFERAKQIATRIVATARAGFGGPPGARGGDVASLTAPTLARYPELAESLKLTDEQKQLLNSTTPKSGPGRTGGFNGPGGPGIRPVALSAEQGETLKKLMGPAPAKPLQATTDPRNRARFVTTTPVELTLLTVPDVQTELKLTDDQSKAVTGLREKWTAFTRSRATVSPKEEDEKEKELRAETDKAIPTILQPQQATRLRQIALQRQLIVRGTIGEPMSDTTYIHPEIAKAIALTEDQQSKIGEVRAAWEAEVVKAFEAGEAFEPTKKKIDAARATREAKALAVLTPEQATKVKDMIGPRYAGRFIDTRGTWAADSRGRSDTGFTAATQRTATMTWGKYNSELSQLANNPDIQAELKLSEEQLKKARAALADLTARGRGGFGTAAQEKYYADRSATIEKALTDILTADQQKRFRQVMLQIREQTPAATTPFADRGTLTNVPTVVASAAAYPGVADAIKVTAEQKAKLLAGERPAVVLTTEQQAAIKAMLGESYKGRSRITPTPPASLARNRGPAERARLITTGTAADALKITPEQREKVSAAYQTYLNATRTGFSPGFGTTNVEERAREILAAVEQLEKAITTDLTPEQAKRLDQLVIQSEVAESLAATLRREEIAKKLGLGADQLTKVAAIETDAEKVADLLDTVTLPREKRAPLATAIRDRLDANLMASLTAAQKATWKELTGEPWTGVRKTPLGSRSFRGAFGDPGGTGAFGGPPGGRGGFPEPQP